MLIGVLSDTHDHLPMIDEALSLFARRGVQAVIHPGDFVAPFALERILRFDGPLHAVFGNNDGERKGLKSLYGTLADGPLRLELGGRRILVHHFIDWCEPADIESADVVITGHTSLETRKLETRELEPREPSSGPSSSFQSPVLQTPLPHR